MPYTTLDDFLKDIGDHAQKHREALQGHDVLLLVQTLQGRSVYLKLQNGEVQVLQQCTEQPACTVTADEKNLLDMINGKLHPMKALLLHKIVIKGDPTQLISLARLV